MDEPDLWGKDLFGDPMIFGQDGAVARRFTMPPFTTLDARTGAWQERKRAWQALGIRGEVGRDAGLVFGTGLGMDVPGTDEEYRTSIFDPVLCELAYRWFCPPRGQVLDPFAGGSVRGIVAGALGRPYWGYDLSSAQVTENEKQRDEIEARSPGLLSSCPIWECGDAAKLLAADVGPIADFVFSCPPYGDLERYSDDPRDLSKMEWYDFLAAYRAIVHHATRRLRPHSFAAFVVAEFRDKDGFYRDFIGQTKEAFAACNVRFYNEAVLLTAVGSACVRVTKQFEVSRKLVKTHQNLLVFCNGDPRRAAARCRGE